MKKLDQILTFDRTVCSCTISDHRDMSDTSTKMIKSLKAVWHNMCSRFSSPIYHNCIASIKHLNIIETKLCYIGIWTPL